MLGQPPLQGAGTDGQAARQRVHGYRAVPHRFGEHLPEASQPVRRRGGGCANATCAGTAAAPAGRNWFQLYIWKDRDRSMALVGRAARAGYDTLLVTVDVPVAGARLRDKRNGFTIRPS
jgi:hypothetical protein